MSINVEVLAPAPPTLALSEVMDDALLQSYAQSSFGIHHATQPLRYMAGYGGYDRAHMLTDLGTDVHPLGHMLATHEMLRATLASANLDDWNDQDFLAAHAAVQLHDIGECTHPELIEECGEVVGDIHRGQKSAEKRAAESRVREAIYRRLDLSDTLRARMEDLIWHRESSSVHDAIETAHDIGGYCVGIRAGATALRYIQTAQAPDERFRCLRNMAQEVTTSQRPLLEERIDTFPYSERILVMTDNVFDRIANEL